VLLAATHLTVMLVRQRETTTGAAPMVVVAEPEEVLSAAA
jgi:hypothetical protein